MRSIKIAPGEHYHLFNRGVNKQAIFGDANDRVRFLFLILQMQSIKPIRHIGREVKDFGQHRVLTKMEEKEKMVEIIAYCLMPNHLHLIVREIEENGIARYMQRVLNAYTKYYNSKYQKSGHLFQGPYKAVHILDNKQLLHLSAYIHRNSRELPEFAENWSGYEWSSYQDFVKENRWEGILNTEIISGQFRNKKEYEDFVETSPAKLLVDEIGYKPF